MEVELSKLRAESVDHLGLVAGMCKELRIVELIDQMLFPSPHCKVTHGERVVAMILNGLGFRNRTDGLGRHSPLVWGPAQPVRPSA